MSATAKCWLHQLSTDPSILCPNLCICPIICAWMIQLDYYITKSLADLYGSFILFMMMVIICYAQRLATFLLTSLLFGWLMV